MAKLSGINHLKAVKALEKAGFYIARQGKHIVMTNDVRIVTITTPQSRQCFYDGRNCSRRRINTRRIQEAALV